MTDSDERRRVDPAEIARAERRATVLRMRNAGATWKSIADQVGVSVDTCVRDVQAALREILREPAEDMIANQRAMLHDMKRAVFVRALRGEDAAIDRMVKLFDHEAKLFGLYAPARVNVGVSDEDFAATAVELMREIGVEPPSSMARPQQNVGEIEGPPIMDADVVEEITDAGPEGDEWVR